MVVCGKRPVCRRTSFILVAFNILGGFNPFNNISCLRPYALGRSWHCCVNTIIQSRILGMGLRVLPFLRILSRFKSSPSQFRTKSLLVTVNFATKQMSGEVLAGEYTGKTLSELTTDDMDLLSASFRTNDRESFVLLQAYRLRNGDSSHESSGEYQSGGYSDLSTEESYKILGLEVNASKEDVTKAHKRLIQRLHPDRGGSDYLAAKINAAKDKLG